MYEPYMLAFHPENTVRNLLENTSLYPLSFLKIFKFEMTPIKSGHTHQQINHSRQRFPGFIIERKNDHPKG
jgi:hypothetical protein